MIKGKDIILSVSDKPLASAKSCKLKLGTKFIEVCSPTDGDVEQYVPTIRSWEVSADTFAAKMADYDTLYTIWKNKQKVTLRFYDNELQTCYKGDAYIKSLDLNAQVGNHATFSVSFQPTGELSKASEEGVSMDTAGTAHTQEVLFWPETGRDYAWIRATTQEQEENNEYVMLKEFQCQNTTRITLICRGMIVEATAETVMGWLNEQDTKSLNDAALLTCNSRYPNKPLVVPAGPGHYKTVTVLMNYKDCIDHPSVKYLTKL